MNLKADNSIHTKEELLNLIGEFTWDFGNEFFIETSHGNFVWKDPDYNGDNTIRKFNGNYGDWLKQGNIPYGRDKGKHLIREYCGESVLCFLALD